MEADIRKQFYAADRIKKVKLKEWQTKVKPYVIAYVADFLFHRTGEIAQMIELGENGYMCNPVILEQGVDMIIRVLENARKGDDQKAQNIYNAFENLITRIEYLWRVVDCFDMYKAIGDSVIQDLDEYAKTQTDPEMLDIIEARKKNIKSRAKSEREVQATSGWQPL